MQKRKQKVFPTFNSSKISYSNPCRCTYLGVSYEYVSSASSSYGKYSKSFDANATIFFNFSCTLTGVSKKKKKKIKEEIN